MNLKKIIKPLYHLAIKLIPRNNLGDKFFSLMHFVRSHHRLPNSKRLFNNYLFEVKHSAEACNPLRAYVSDKAFVKDYVTAKVGAEFNVPTITVLNDMEAVRNFDFPPRCCIKPTHLTGAVILRESGEDVDFEVMDKWLRTNCYDIGREKNYRYLKPKIIVEPLIFDNTNNEDFKFFCFEGKARFVQVDIDRRHKHTRLYFDRDWNEQEWSILYQKSVKKFQKPANFDSMLGVADCLSSDFEFIRVDLYTDGNEIYVGELTNWPENGNGYFVPRSSELTASKLLLGLS